VHIILQTVQDMTDRLASLLAHFSISAKTFHAGALCGINSMTGSDGLGQLHLIRQGEVKVMHGSKLVVTSMSPVCCCMRSHLPGVF
jgi:hypothetical protein